MKIRHFTYTKENGDESSRFAVIVLEPRENYLVYDISKLSTDETKYFLKAVQEIEDYREECLQEFEDVTGIKINSLWRSFKPGGIEWDLEDEI